MNARLPPGPGHLGPIDVTRWVKNPFPVMERLQARYGDAFTIGLPGMPYPIVVVADPEVVKAVFGLGPDEGHAGKTNALLEPLLGSHSLFLLDGAAHLRHRKMMLPALHGERMHGYGRAMLALADDAIDGWPLRTTFPAHDAMQAITLHIVIRTVFGIETGPRFAKLAEVLAQMLEAGASPVLAFPFMRRDLGPLSPWGKFVRLSRKAGEILRAEIRAGREAGASGRTDVLAMLLEARDESGTPLGEDELHDELVTLLTAGHETTATALAWALRWILADPQLVARLHEEIATAGGDPQRIAQLPLLDGAVRGASPPARHRDGGPRAAPGQDSRGSVPPRRSHGRACDLPRAPQAFALSRAGSLPARALRDLQAGALGMGAVRRWAAQVHRRGLCGLRDEDGAGVRARAGRRRAGQRRHPYHAPRSDHHAFGRPADSGDGAPWTRLERIHELRALVLGAPAPRETASPSATRAACR